MTGPWKYMDLDENTIRLGVSLGLMRSVRVRGKGLVYELTEKGSEWLDRYLDNELAVARCMAL